MNDNTWLATVPFDAATGKLVNFKFLVRQDGDQPLLENLTTRKLGNFPRAVVLRWIASGGSCLDW